MTAACTGERFFFLFPFSCVKNLKDNFSAGIKGIRPVEISPKYFISP
jgi:hypothetical protein